MSLISELTSKKDNITIHKTPEPTCPRWKKGIPDKCGWFYVLLPFSKLPTLIEVHLRGADANTKRFSRSDMHDSSSMLKENSFSAHYGPVDAPPVAPDVKELV